MFLLRMRFVGGAAVDDEPEGRRFPHVCVVPDGAAEEIFVVLGDHLAAQARARARVQAQVRVKRRAGHARRHEQTRRLVDHDEHVAVRRGRANVVVTNPTHYAVAIRYNPDEAPAPIVLCKGVDHLAMKIKAEARKHDVPTIENRPLARALYATAVVGQMIPEELYAAVAQIIAVIVRRRAKSKQRGVRP